jgi:hypothetical protein
MDDGPARPEHPGLALTTTVRASPPRAAPPRVDLQSTSSCAAAGRRGFPAFRRTCSALSGGDKKFAQNLAYGVDRA